MKMKIAAALMKAAIIFGRFLLLYPFYGITCALLYHPIDAVRVWLFLGGGMAFLLAGFGYSRLLFPFFRKKNKKVLFRVTQLLLGIALAVTVTVFWPEITVWFGLFLAPILFAAYEIGITAAFQNYDDLCSNKMMVLGVCLYVGIYILGWVIRANGGPDVGEMSLTPLFLCFILIYGMVGNQTNLDDLMNRRKHTMSDLPTKIRQYNMVLMGSICGIILLAYIFREPLGVVFGKITAAFMNVGLILGQLLVMLISLPATGNKTDVAPPATEDIMPPALGNPGKEGALPLDQIGLVVALVIIAVVVILRWRDLAEWFLGIGRRIRKAINRFLGKEVKESAKKEQQTVETEFYTDEIQSVEQVRSRAVKEEDLDAKRAKKLLRAYDKIDDPVKKVRFGYRAILSGVHRRGVEYTKADTGREIGKKLSPAPCAEAFDGATGLYEQVRYGEQIPTEPAMEEMAGYMKEVLTGDKKKR